MADGHFPDVELLRRELAALILEWAGKAVKDDPDGALSTALTRAVSEAARSAVAEQHQILTADAADRIAEALERRKTGGVFLGRAPALRFTRIAVAAVALLAIAFFFGLQAGRKEGALPPTSGAVSAPIAPLAPAAPAVSTTEEQATSPATPRVAAPQSAGRPQRAERAERPAAKPASRPPPRELGRPAPTTDEASPRSTQPVGSATRTPPSPTPGTTP